MLSVFITPWTKPTRCGGSAADFCKPGQINRHRRLAQIRKISANSVIEQFFQRLDFTSGGKNLKVAETGERRRHPAYHGTRLGFGIAVIKHVTDNLFTG